MDHSNFQDNKIMKKITLIILFGLFFILNVNAEIVCTSTTTAADIVADEDKTCTVDAEVMTVTLKKESFIMLLVDLHMVMMLQRLGSLKLLIKVAT